MFASLRAKMKPPIILEGSIAIILLQIYLVFNF
jgi:hypothetical protein